MRTIYASLLAVSAALALAANVRGQGNLTPPGAPAPTMKSLDQVEARTPIPGGTSTYTINADGSYYLTGNITVSTGNGITITAGNVTLDLNGFTIASTSAGANGGGISSNFGGNLAIRHGHILGTTTYNSSGAGGFTAGGFFDGVVIFGSGSTMIENVSVSGVGNLGFRLPICEGRISHCEANICVGYGFFVTQQTSTVDHCVAQSCGSVGIQAGTVADCTVSMTGSGAGIIANTATNCYASTVGGVALSANTAVGCSGSSISATGIAATSATDCYGTSTSNNGINATTAIGCSGYTVTGFGVGGSVANGCYGNSSGSGTGINATTVTGSTAFSGAGNGVVCTTATSCSATTNGTTAAAYAIDCTAGGIATGCTASVSAAPAISLRARIANGCNLGVGATAITNKYNMP